MTGYKATNQFLMRTALIGKRTNSAGTILATSYSTTMGSSGLSADSADGDKYFLYFILDGTETKLYLGNRKNTNCGIFDIYLNNTLDSSAYDDYAAAGTTLNREITLTVVPVPGLNTLELRVNGKNVTSTDYALAVHGATIS